MRLACWFWRRAETIFPQMRFYVLASPKKKFAIARRARRHAGTRVACWLRCPAATVFSLTAAQDPCVADRKVRDREDALATTRDACAPQIRGYAIFLRKRSAQRMKRRFDIRMRTRRFGQYSKKFAPRKMIARMSAMKYVVGNSAPSA